MESFLYLEGLRAYFEQFGQVTECVIMKDPTGRSRCFGFVSFSDPEVLDSLLQKTHILDKKQVNFMHGIVINHVDRSQTGYSQRRTASTSSIRCPSFGTRREQSFCWWDSSGRR